MDHLQRWSRIFRSEETETDLSIWIPTEISGIFGIMESTPSFAILRCYFRENVNQMYQDEKRTWGACYVLHAQKSLFPCQICKFVISSLSSPLIRELKQARRRRQQKPHKFAYLTMKNSIFARFARAFFIFWHFEDVLPLSTTWNDLFCSCVDDVSIWKYSILSSYAPSAGSNLIPGQLEHTFQAQWLWIIEKFLQKRKVTFSDDVRAFVDVVFA